jgi:hypothetical protein
MALISFWFFPTFILCMFLGHSYWGGGFFEKSFENLVISFTLLFYLLFGVDILSSSILLLLGISQWKCGKCKDMFRLPLQSLDAMYVPSQKNLLETHVFSASRCSIFRFSAAAISLTSVLVALCAA